LSLYRDLHAFYTAKDTLFPDRTSGLIFFENMMGIFFTGRDLTEDVMGEFHPDLRVVAARQSYDMNIGTPDPQLPAFALVMRLRDPDRFSEVMEEAWQKALGLVNFTRGQQAEPGLILDRPTHGGVTMTTASFSAAGATDRNHLDQRYNFRPTLALPPGYAVLSSTEGLARDLVDALAREQTTPPPALPSSAHSLLQINGPQVSRILAANRPALVRENMIKEGHNEAEAELAIGTLLAITENIDRISLELGAPQNSPQATLRLQFTQP
jgi:hypothetical protein